MAETAEERVDPEKKDDDESPTEKQQQDALLEDVAQPPKADVKEPAKEPGNNVEEIPRKDDPETKQIEEKDNKEENKQQQGSSTIETAPTMTTNNGTKDDKADATPTATQKTETSVNESNVTAAKEDTPKILTTTETSANESNVTTIAKKDDTPKIETSTNETNVTTAKEDTPKVLTTIDVTDKPTVAVVESAAADSKKETKLLPKKDAAANPKKANDPAQPEEEVFVSWTAKAMAEVSAEARQEQHRAIGKAQKILEREAKQPELKHHHSQTTKKTVARKSTLSSSSTIKKQSATEAFEKTFQKRVVPQGGRKRVAAKTILKQHPDVTQSDAFRQFQKTHGGNGNDKPSVAQFIEFQKNLESTKEVKSKKRKSVDSSSKAKPKKKAKSGTVAASPGKKAPAKEIWSGLPEEPLEGGWPEGWTKKVFQRASGATKGSTDKYWYSPNNKKFRSLTEVKRFLAALKTCGGDEDQAWRKFKGKS